MHFPRRSVTSHRSVDGKRVGDGFTLIEVMITLAIVAILASIALPSYREYVRRGQLPEAFASLADYRVKMEQYYQDNRNFGVDSCAGGAAGPTWAAFASGKHFSFACAVLDAGQGYRITATGLAGSAAAGHVYTIDHNNSQATTKFKGAAVEKSCWLARGNEC